MDDEFGGFLDRESVLAGGVPAKRANTVLFLIENRTAQLIAQSRQAANPYQSQAAKEERDLAFLEAFALGNEPPLRPRIQDLERHAPGWATLVPRNPRVQAAIAHRLGEKYEFTRDAVPGLREALGLDSAAVQRSYNSMYGQALDSIFAQRSTPGDRLRWAWASLAGRLENLPPFWTVYAMTLTETLGMTILALPIALAGVGPMAGVTLLVVFGLVNVLTIVFVSEAVARNGSIRYGSGFIGKVVEDYLGRAGSIVLSLSIFILCFLVLQAFYFGFSSALEGITHVPAWLWIALLFLVGIYFLRRESLDATIASALVVGTVNVFLIVVLSVVAFFHEKPSNLLHMDVPFVGGRPFEPEILGLVFGVVLAAYFGHLTVSSYARVVLERDPSARSLIWGTVAAQATAIFLYCIFVLGVNGAIAPKALSSASGTALDPLATEIGPVIYVLGAVFIVLGMGMGSIHYTRILFNLARERLPQVSRPVLVLPRRQGLLLFRDRWRLGLVYLGLRGDKARFRIDAEFDGALHRVEKDTATSGTWEVLGENGDPELLDRLPGLRDLTNRRKARLSLEILDADQQRVRLRVTSSMRPVYEGARDDAGLDMAGVFELPELQAGLVGWMVRQGGATPAEAAEYTGQNESETRQLLRELVEKGFVAEHADSGGGVRYEARLATRRGRRGADQLWQSLAAENQQPDAGTSRPSQRSGASALLRRVSSSKGGNFSLAASPVVAAFLMAEWLLFEGSGSFTGLIGLIGVIIVPILGGILPVLLLLASRRRGERIPTVVYRFLGNPVLLVLVYVLFLSSIFLHGLFIWTNPLQRIVAVAVGVVVVMMTLTMRKSFARRTIVELREEKGDDGEEASFSVTTGSHPTPADVRLTYPKGEQRYEAATGSIPEFPSLQRAVFRPADGEGATSLKVWAHRVTPEGDSEGLAGLLRVRRDGERDEEDRVYDLKLSGGQVMLPVGPDGYLVEITLSGPNDPT